MNPDQIWAAGLFEGEGCISTSCKSGKVYMMLQLATSDEDIMDRFVTAIGGFGTVKVEEPGKNPHQKKPIYRWRVQNMTHIEHVLEILNPWLGERRMARLVEVQNMLTPVVVGPHKKHLASVGPDKS
jgi:hypothetical protein